MSRKLLAFLLSEFKVVRIICKNEGCGAVTELPMEGLGIGKSFHSCPVCDRILFEPDASVNNATYQGVRGLGLILNSIAKNDKHADIEFVIPCKDDKVT